MSKPPCFTYRHLVLAGFLACASFSFGHAAAPSASSSLLSPVADVAVFATTGGTRIASVQSGGAPGLIATFPAMKGYPSFDFVEPSGNALWNLSAFAGVKVEVTNTGTESVVFALRVDNAGSWKDKPWNVEQARIAPGETRALRVVFGRAANGKPAYALDPARITVVKLFVINPTAGAELRVNKLAGFGTPDSVPPAVEAKSAAPVTNRAAAAGSDATFSPAISGELLDLSRPDALAGADFAEASAVIEDGRIKATFNAGSTYPSLRFPAPEGGWNLSAFGGIELTVTNPGAARVVVHLRADNPGSWKDEPWNTEKLGIAPGETKTIRLTFGKQNGAPAFPLNPARISAIQVFLSKPGVNTTLLLSDLKAAGSPAAVADSAALTKAEDRDIPVIPPAWLGSRPPITGDWVRTLDENFDGDRLDESRWSTRMTWGGPTRGQLQRYTPENVVVSGGVAALVAERNPGHERNDPTLPTRDYTSGLIQSYDKWSQKYGYMEARVKLPTARGLWPAFWTMPDRGRDSGLDMGVRRSTSIRHGQGMEIDILEHLAEWGPGRNNVAVHWDGYGPNHQSWGTSHVYFGPTPDGWHNFGLLWEPGKLTWFIDGKKVVEWANPRVADVPAYLKLNIQIGGWATSNVDDAALPDRMLIDYVRAWQLRERL
ncbi:MAG: glycoside hydrolase family 16 protein [Verrucomicrobiota bacterium]